jgi:hypothetical protein
MIGNPKYNYNDVVSFKIKDYNDEERILIGSVYIFKLDLITDSYTGQINKGL